MTSWSMPSSRRPLTMRPWQRRRKRSPNTAPSMAKPPFKRPARPASTSMHTACSLVVSAHHGPARRWKRSSTTSRWRTALWSSVIDYHTGLGPYGYGEPICAHLPGSAGMKRVVEMYGDSVGVPELGTSSSIPLHGTSREMWNAELGDNYTYVAPGIRHLPDRPWFACAA